MSSRSVPHSAAASRAFAAGELLAKRYRLIRRIGEGAMGTVWVAHNDVLDVDVAVKVLRIDPNKTDATRAYKRLLREARATARLGHPGIVRVFDFGQTEDKSPYIVMELLEGESLADQMTRRPQLGMVESVQLLLPIVDALSVAHGRGIVHRDVKPENIFLSRDQYDRLQPKIVDFGIARLAEAGRSLTRSGALLGTPDYMAPEQARGEPGIDHRVDVWAICIVLYEVLTGRRPFASDATNYLAVLRAIVHERAPSIRNYGAGDDALWLIIERGLKKRAADRWSTMRELGEALALWLYERGTREDVVGASLKTTWLQAGLDGVKIETPSVRPPAPLAPGRPKPPPPALHRTKNGDADVIAGPGAPAAIGEPSLEPGEKGIHRGLATLLEPLPASDPPAGGASGPLHANESPRRSRALALGAAIVALGVLGGALAAVLVARRAPAPAARASSAHTITREAAPSVGATFAEGPPGATRAVQERVAEPEGRPASLPASAVMPDGAEPQAPPPVPVAATAPASSRRPAAARAASRARTRAPAPDQNGVLPSAKTYDFGF